MIDISKVKVVGFEEAIRGMRNPMNSWHLSDSKYCDDIFNKCDDCRYPCSECDLIMDPVQGHQYLLGNNDLALAHRLAEKGSVHAKFRRMIVVYCDILAPLYWWKEFDTYKVGTVANSCSTMHKIHSKEFEISDFSCEHLYSDELEVLKEIIDHLNGARELFLDRDGAKSDWWQMIQLLPSSYNQLRTVMMNYETLSNIFEHRRNHKLDEWVSMCRWMYTLPYSELITGVYYE